MIFPHWLQGMKQCHEITSGRVGRVGLIRLVQTAIRTLEREIVFACCAGFAFRHDVVDVEDCCLPDLPQPAIST
jgi:hypothetical protein